MHFSNLLSPWFSFWVKPNHKKIYRALVEILFATKEEQVITEQLSQMVVMLYPPFSELRCGVNKCQHLRVVRIASSRRVGSDNHSRQIGLSLSPRRRESALHQELLLSGFIRAPLHPTACGYIWPQNCHSSLPLHMFFTICWVFDRHGLSSAVSLLILLSRRSSQPVYQRYPQGWSVSSGRIPDWKK